MKSIYILLLFLTGFTSASIAQFATFHSGDWVSFLGNSITMNGGFYNYVELYYLTRFPKEQVRFFNNGISGDVSGGMLRRMQADVLVNKPTWCVVMAGMNDVNRGLYAEKYNNDQDAKQRRQEALERYFRNMDSIVNQLIDAGVKVVLQTPTIYDQTASTATINLKGVNDALGQCAIYIKRLSEKYKLPVVDYWSAMNNTNAAVQTLSPSASIIERDRVHPAMYGYFLMATEFLKAQQAPSYVAMVSIDAKKSIIKHSAGGNAVLLRSSSKGVAFTWEEDALPFPLLSADFKPDSLFDFSKSLNNEILQVKSLKKEKYVVFIDSVEVGQYSNKALSEGINLAINNLTPQNKQAAKVLQLLQEYWKIERRLRQVKYVEYQLLPIGAKNDPTFFDVNLRHRTDKIMALLKDKPEDDRKYYRRNLDDYIINKPRYKELEKEAENIYKVIQQTNKPARHIYSIVPVK